MAFFGKSKDKNSAPRALPAGLQPGQIFPVNWARTPNKKFPRLVDLDPEESGLDGREGIYVVWHTGVRPEWVYIGKTQNMAAAMHALAYNKEVMHYEKAGGLFVTWTLIDKMYHDGILTFLSAKLQPVVDNADIPSAETVSPIAVIPPGLAPTPAKEA